MEEGRRIDVAIIGAGPVGMTLAVDLIRHGLSVRIVDREPGPKTYSRAPVFWPRAQDALDLMGIHHLWHGRTVPMNRVHLNVYGNPAGTVALDDGDAAHPVPMLVGQDVTEGILDRHLADLGTPVERETEATAVELHEDGAVVTLKTSGRGAERFEAGWVIGCEGGHSLVRRSADFGWDGHPLEGLMVPLADAKVRWSLPSAQGEAFVALTDAGYLLTLPLPDFQRIIVAVPDSTAPGEEPSITLESVARLTAEALGGPVELSDSPWTTVVRYGNHLARRFRCGRALLAGDAAHSIAPLSGQGMNTGVQDAFDLAWKLAYVHKGWAPDLLLESYTADRRPVAERLVHATDRFFEIVRSPDRIRKRVMRAVAPTVLDFGVVRQHFAAFYTEVDVVYPASPLNDAKSHHAPNPGEHVRDGQLVAWPDLKHLRLYDVLRGTRWTAIAFTGDAPSTPTVSGALAALDALRVTAHAECLGTALIVGAPSPPDESGVEASEAAILIDAWGALHRRYDATAGALLLVRPDGYVAFHRALDARAIDAAMRYLGRLFGRPPAEEAPRSASAT